VGQLSFFYRSFRSLELLRLIKNAKDDEAKKEFAQENEPKAEAIKKKGERERKRGKEKSGRM
jgi:hypothetical protein